MSAVTSAGYDGSMFAIPAQFQALAGKFQERHGRRLAPAASALLVLALGWGLAQLLWSLVPPPESAQWRPAPVQPDNTSARSNGPNIESVIAARLFGVYQAPANPQTAALSSAPDTSLNLTLLGILAGSGEHDSRALIGQQSGEELPYSIGQDIVAGVSLQAIFPDRVILSRNGSLETLRLDKDSPSTSTAPPVVQESTASAGNAQMAQIREQILQDPSKAGEFIRVQPASAPGGGTKGYRIYPGKDRALFSNSGLRPGDLVTAVNGIQLDDGQKALQTLNDLKAAGSVTLTLERGGQTQTVNVSLTP